MIDNIISIDEMKSLELDILTLFVEYCEKHKLRYILYAGTLLGAIRHQGFIPWDDDIDVAMPRPDYEAFMARVKQDPVAKNLKVFSYRDENSYYWAPVTKLVDIRTEGHEVYQGKGIHNGVWIDIFPIDGVPNDVKLQKKLIRSISVQMKLLTLETMPFIFTRHPLKLAKRIAALPVHLFGQFKNHKKRSERVDTFSKQYKYEDFDLVGVVSSGCGFGEIIEKHVIEDTILAPFETITVRIPKDYGYYLTKLFGDYMTPPPVEQRIPIHGYSCWWKKS